MDLKAQFQLTSIYFASFIQKIEMRYVCVDESQATAS